MARGNDARGQPSGRSAADDDDGLNALSHDDARVMLGGLSHDLYL